MAGTLCGFPFLSAGAVGMYSGVLLSLFVIEISIVRSPPLVVEASTRGADWCVEKKKHRLGFERIEQNARKSHSHFHLFLF